jgi:FG-GAP-like repeat/FG-GAP repeat
VIAAAPASAAPPPIGIVTGQDAGWPDVRGWSRVGEPARQIAPWGFDSIAFSPYPTYQDGVRVAVGDVNGDGKAEIVTAPGKGGWTELRLFDGKRFGQIATLMPYRDAIWWNGAFVATGDTNGDGRDEVVDGLDAGCCTTIHVVEATTGAATSAFYPSGNNSQTGTRVAAADLNGDGKAEILAVPLGSSRVSAFGLSGGEPFRTYQTFGGETAGVAIAAGDLIGTPRPELVAAANTGGGVHVKMIDAESGTGLASFFPYGAAAAVARPEVAVGDVNGDGRRDIVVAAQFVGGTQVRALDSDGSHLGSFFVLEPGIVPGASLAVGDLDGDGKAEIVLGGGPTTPAPWPPAANGTDQRVVVYRLNGTLVGGFTAYPGLFQGGVRVALADVERDGRPDIITAPGPGMEPEIGIFGQRWLQNRDRGTRFSHFLACVAAGDLDADGQPEIVAGMLAPPARIRAFELDGQTYGPLLAPFPPDRRGVQVGVADPNGTGRGWILAGETSGPNPLLAAIDPASGSVIRAGRPAPEAANGIRVGAGDLDLDGRDEILVTSGWGGDGDVRILGPTLRPKWFLGVYTSPGWGMNVAAAPRIGLPLRADALTVRPRARQRARLVVARFHDAAGPASAPSRFRAAIEWGDGTSWRGVVLKRGAGIYEVRSTKRYARRGTYKIVVTLTDSRSRVSIAKSRAVVRAAT